MIWERQETWCLASLCIDSLFSFSYQTFNRVQKRKMEGNLKKSPIIPSVNRLISKNHQDCSVFSFLFVNATKVPPTYKFTYFNITSLWTPIVSTICQVKLTPAPRGSRKVRRHPFENEDDFWQRRTEMSRLCPWVLFMKPMNSKSWVTN